MPLKDYTTKKEPEETIQEISKLLKNFGVKGVLSEYDDAGNIISMSFKINIDNQDMGFKLPTDWKPVLKTFEENCQMPRRLCTEDQARRTAWRLIYHWCDSQLALVRVNMVKIQTIFLPYIVTNDGKTLSEHFDINSQLLLNN